MKTKKPKDLKIISYGSEIVFKLDSHMTNIWINNAPISYDNAKTLKDWLDKYLKYTDEKEK